MIRVDPLSELHSSRLRGPQPVALVAAGYFTLLCGLAPFLTSKDRLPMSVALRPNTANVEKCLRIHLLKMAALGTGGTFDLHVRDGICKVIDPPPTPRDPTIWTAIASQRVSAAQRAVLTEVIGALDEAAARQASGHVYVDVAAGVPQLPIREQFLDVIGDLGPRRPPPLRPSAVRHVGA